MKLNGRARSTQYWLLVLLILMPAFVVAGSAVAGMHTGSEARTTFESWKVEYAISGGIAGINRQITLSSDGSLVATDRRTNKRVVQQVPPEQLSPVTDSLRRLESEPPRTGAGRPGQCADCFQSTLNLTLDDRQYTVEPGALETPRYNELTRLLASMLKQALT